MKKLDLFIVIVCLNVLISNGTITELFLAKFMWKIFNYSKLSYLLSFALFLLEKILYFYILHKKIDKYIKQKNTLS